ncbi:MAG: acyl-CoA thioesterase [Firmicutes bacterium]|nr:acyl-CoA thioesterase [Bacillota bacterium]
MKTSINFRVRYQETDKMGVVHHSVYFIWFEAGRTEWMRERGLTYRECEAKGWFLPLIESGAKYLSPAFYDDLVEVEAELIPKEGAEFHFEYRVINLETKKLLATGFTKHVLVDADYRINKTATKNLKELLKL